MCLALLVSSCATARIAPDSADFAELPLPIAHGTRIGVEFLPPDIEPHGAFDSIRLVEDQDGRADEQQARLTIGNAPDYGPPPPTVESLSPYEELQESWELRREQIQTKRDTAERVALRFLSELVGDDRKRVTRALGSSMLDSQQRLEADPLSNYLDEVDREAQQSQLTRNGTRMIRRPLRNALKELPWFRNVEVALHNFKDETPHSREQKRRKGRISVRLRASHFEDPLEFRWIHSGFQVATSIEHGKLSYTARVTDRLSVRLRSRYDYRDYDLRLFGNLEYRLDAQTTVNALAGNRVNTLSGPATYPGGPNSDEKGTGFLLFVEHLF